MSAAFKNDNIVREEYEVQLYGFTIQQFQRESNL